MGLTGLQTAIQLKTKHPSATVMAIDRHPWSLGASTRNAGFACFANLSELLDDLQHSDASEVYGLVKKRFLGLQKLRNNFGDTVIEYLPTGSKEVFFKTNEQDLYHCIDSLQGVNTILSEELGLDKTFTFSSNSPYKGSKGIISNQHEGVLNTGKLFSTLYDTAQKLGVKLIGGLEVTEWSIGQQIRVETAQGIDLTTTCLVLCTNGFSEQFLPEEILPARGQVIVTEKLTDTPATGAFFYDKGFTYWRDLDGRILLGGARNLDVAGETTIELGVNTKLVDELKSFLFEKILGSEVAIEYQWSGIMGMGTEKQKSPLVKELEPNVILAARLGGMGVALSSLVAEEVANLVN